MTTVCKARPSELPGLLDVLEGQGLHPAVRDDTTFSLPWIASGQNLVNIDLPQSEVDSASRIIREFRQTRQGTKGRARGSRKSVLARLVLVAVFPSLLIGIGSVGWGLAALVLLLPLALAQPKKHGRNRYGQRHTPRHPRDQSVPRDSG